MSVGCWQAIGLLTGLVSPTTVILCYALARLALVGYIKFIILDISLPFFYFNSQCLASLETNFSLVAWSEKNIYIYLASQEFSELPFFFFMLVYRHRADF